MASRADMIRSARRRVDARRDARNRANIRDQARANYGRNLGRTKFNPIEKRAPSNRWDRKLGKWIKDKASKGGEGIMGAYGAMARAGKELFVDPIMKESENERLMGELYKDEDSMDRIRESLMTDKNKEFYEKYMRLADLTSDQDKAREYRETANTALSNAQISSRLNYALGQLGYDTIGKEGFASYQPDFTGGEGTGFEEGASPRFNLDNFLGGLRGTKAGKDFYNEALAAQANEPGDTLISQYMKNYPTTFNYEPDTFVGTMGSIPSFMLEKDGMVIPPQESDMSYFDPYLSPSLPFYGKKRQYYLNHLASFENQ